MRNKILIYCDYGTNDIGRLKDSLDEYFIPQGVSVETTDAKGIVNENNLDESVLAFFMPGGRATPYLEKLKTQGNQKIAAYVEQGGIYFGICAGAYYASRQVYFETDIKELCIIQQCGLNLIDADAIGTLYKELNISPYTMDFNSMAPVSVRWHEDNEIHMASYHGGPYFKLPETNSVQILATYEINGNNLLPAVVMQEYGQGCAIASGLHIEDSGKNLRQILFDRRADKEKAEKVVCQLEANETSRHLFFEKLMQKIKSRS